MAFANIAPNERYAFIGKTRSGKTAAAMVLAGTYARVLRPPWEVWWIDTKNDPDDIKALRRWGARNYADPADRETSNIKRFLYWYVTTPSNPEMFDPGTVAQVQEICRLAYERKHVILCVDEYTQAVPSKQNPGEALRNVFARGGGRKVGLIGLTQEPVFVPRMLLSQATHTVMFNLTYSLDIEYLQKNIDRGYEPPLKKYGSDGRYGFYWRWNDGGGELEYWPNQQVWYEQLKVAMDRPEVQSV